MCVTDPRRWIPTGCTGWLHWLHWLAALAALAELAALAALAAHCKLFFPRPKTCSETFFTTNFFCSEKSFHCKLSVFSLQSHFAPLQSFGFFTSKSLCTVAKCLCRGKKKFAVKRGFHCKLFFFHCKVTLLRWLRFGSLWGGGKWAKSKD